MCSGVCLRVLFFDSFVGEVFVVVGGWCFFVRRRRFVRRVFGVGGTVVVGGEFFLFCEYLVWGV